MTVENTVPRTVAEVDDHIVLSADIPVDYAAHKNDGDGNALLGGGDISYVARIDTTVSSFGDPTNNNHYGAAADGQFYNGGVATVAPGANSFGTLAGGRNQLSWGFNNEEPLADGDGTAGAPPVLLSDDTIQMAGTGTAGWTLSHQITSRYRWYLKGDFRVKVDFTNFSKTAGTDAEFVMEATSNVGQSGNIARVIRTSRPGSENYRRDTIDNGVLANVYESSGGAGASATLEIERIGSTLNFYYNGALIGGAGVSATTNIGTKPVVVEMHFAQLDTSAGTVDISNFVVVSGTPTTKVGWYREASGAHRGTKQEFPDDLGVVCTATSVDLIDLATHKLWMRFVQGADNLLHLLGASAPRPNRAVFQDGMLFISYGAPGEAGGGIIIDFTLDMVLLHRTDASAYTGSNYGLWTHPRGLIAQRNAGLGYLTDRTAFQLVAHEVADCSVYFAGDFQYHAVASNGGVDVFRRERWVLWDTSTDRTFTPARTRSTETAAMSACLLDPATGDLFYMGGTNIYSVAQATWDASMTTTQQFTAATTKAIPGTRPDVQMLHTFLLIGSSVYVAADEGVYSAAWPGGSFSLVYGASGSGATYEILPANERVTSIAYSQDSGVNVLTCALESDTPLAVVNLDTNALHGVAPRRLGKTPMVVAAY